ncbi:MAG: methyltransferase domain-containing protein [Calditrichaceae bacterium]|nr:methyltransferase domain-containing protein [Calditrichaceae bacterium]MBN2710160.1 methyltransferase domain-containing protein [Calditrichaceae bacterium]RQV95813.1 MAG: methyltransferase domain-containing protein [Calditrichota bacterium]
MRSCFIYFIIMFYISILTAQNYNRDRWQQPDRILDSVGVKPGMIIGEAGAGNGYLTFFLSRHVGDSGLIYANDISRNVLKEIDLRCKKENIANIETVLGKITNPLFPENRLDMVIMLRAFHDFTEPVEWMKNVIPSLKSGALLVIVDGDPDKMGSGHHHFYTREKVLSIMKQTAFELVKMMTFLEKDTIYVFRLKRNH